ncbi:universal stress protein [Hoyosella rhizosphaerae]|uniref:Universal stress protein n=1 Tax=Hoyosella rhizosphaerae TaxID=1755582 RepID=A0A916UA45_9ACTN|nr:universal stress protein [Hoyosella rhizosphaerae]MBN4926054.1 universal stress protein [Hoyosella rhizosphaerae]GGC65911.1 universal stress protein [Hoyosella rhizosphaerae]
MNQPNPNRTSRGKHWGTQPIAVVVDGTEESLRGVEWAAGEAALHKAGVMLVRPKGSVLRRVPGSVIDADVQRAREIIKAHNPDASIEVRTVGGGVKTGLVPVTLDAHMLVIAAGSEQGKRTRLGAPYAALLAAKAHCPIVVVPRNDLTATHVVVGIDGTESSEDAIAVAFEEAAARGAVLKAVHTWNDFQLTTAIAAEASLAWDEVETGEKVVLSTRLAGWRDKFPEVDVVEVVTKDSPARQLAHQSQSAALLVVGSHGRGPISGLIFRSTSETLMYASRCPLVVVRNGLRKE